LAVGSEFAAECLGETLSGHAEAEKERRIGVVVRVDLICQFARDRIGDVRSVGRGE